MEDQPHENEEDHLSQCVYKRSLYEADTSDALDLCKLQPKDFISVLIEPAYFLLGKAKTFDQFNIAQ